METVLVWLLPATVSFSGVDSPPTVVDWQLEVKCW
jgi:hypothetical protein